MKFIPIASALGKLGGVANLAARERLIQAIRSGHVAARLTRQDDIPADVPIEVSEDGTRTLLKRSAPDGLPWEISGMVIWRESLIFPYSDRLVKSSSAVEATGGKIFSGQLCSNNIHGDRITFSLEKGPDEGTITVNADGSYIFDPDGRFQDLDAGAMREIFFAYRIANGSGISDTCTKTLTVVRFAAENGLHIFHGSLHDQTPSPKILRDYAHEGLLIEIDSGFEAHLKGLERSPKNRVGAPDGYDWPPFDESALRILEEEGLPLRSNESGWRTQADFVRRMQTWISSNWGPEHEPSTSTIKGRLTKKIIPIFEERRKTAGN